MATKTLARGLTLLAKGARIGNPGLAGLGAAMVAVRLLRRSKPKELLYSTKLKPGQTVKIVRPDLGKAVEVTAGE